MPIGRENTTPEQQPPLYSQQSGVTLVELAVVLFMLLVILIPMSAAIQRSLSTSNEIYRLSTCAFLAQEKVEEVRMRASCFTSTLDCPNVASQQAFHPIGTVDYTETAPACAFPAPFTSFKCDVVWAENDDEGGALSRYFRDIQVRVWFDSDSDDVFDAEETDVLLQTGLTVHSPLGSHP